MDSPAPFGSMRASPSRRQLAWVSTRSGAARRRPRQQAAGQAARLQASGVAVVGKEVADQVLEG